MSCCLAGAFVTLPITIHSTAMSIFRFKQFNVSQAGCAMKVNTDGVLLGALANGDAALSALDIGTGTGVISLMLAQRFPALQVDAVELDEAAAQTAANNFFQSPFADRLTMHAQSFQSYFAQQPGKMFELIISNPPFYIQSLPSPGEKKSMAKHADDHFFQELIAACTAHLSTEGILWVILPLSTSALVKQVAASHGLCIQQVISIQSYSHTAPHREILAMGHQQTEASLHRLTIYNAPKIYHAEYKNLLKNFLTIF